MSKCNHDSKLIIRVTVRNGVEHVREHCAVCFSSLRAIKKSQLYLENIDYHSLEKMTSDEIDERRKEYWSEIFTQREAKDDEWREAYNTYLNTLEWEEKRQAVIKRDNNTCQGCLAAKIDVIHHLSYENVGDELLFQLVGLCQRCHDNAHVKTDLIELYGNHSWDW